MNKKFLSAILFGALMVTSTGTFVSCKDYDDEIDEINGKIDKIETTLADLKSQIGEKGVSSVTFDEKTGVLTVVDGTGTKTYEIKTPATGVEKTVVTVDDDKNLKVDGEVIGKLGDTVEVKENELYVNNKATGIKVGKYAILENDADGMYTITLPDAKGELQTIKLPKATSGLMNVGVNAAIFTAKNTVTPTGSAPAGIAWGKASKAIAWKGAKKDITEGQLLLGRYTEGSVTVVPSGYNLGAQTLKLVASNGVAAPVTVVATSSDKLQTGERAASGNGNWALAITMDKTVTAANVATAFATKVDGQAKNLKYALSVNGDLVTGYEFMIDTDETAASALTITDIKIGGKDGATNANTLANALEVSSFKLGTNEIVIEDKGQSNIGNHLIYDSYLEIADTDRAGRYGVTVDGMKITAPDKAAGIEIPFIVHIMDVTGVETKQYIKVTFGTVEVEDEPIADQEYKLMPEKNFVINLGNTFSALTDEQADKIQGNITWASDGNFFKDAFEASKVTYFKDEACKEQVTDLATAATIKTIKYAKINADQIVAEAPKAGATKLTITLKDGSDGTANEIKKVSASYTIKLPTFDELTTVNTLTTWNEAGTVLTTTMGYISNKPTIPVAGAYLVKDGVKNLTINDIKYATTASYEKENGDEETIEMTDIASLIVNDKLTVNEFTVEASIALAGTTTPLKVSKKFTVNLKTIFEGAKLVYYSKGAAQTYATVDGDGNVAAMSGKAGEEVGLALVFNGKKVAVLGTEYKFDGVTAKLSEAAISEAKVVNVGFALDTEKASKGTYVAPEAAVAANTSNGTAAKPATGIQITGLNQNEGGVLVATFQDIAGVKFTSTIDYLKK